MSTRSPSRRQVEQDVAMMVEAHSMAQVLHALVEVCHSKTPKTGFGWVGWEDLCATLRLAERQAAEHQL